jgi:hypothetical protein
VLGAFSAQCGYEDDGHGSPGSWLAWQARMTRGAAGGAVGWMRRLAAHPLVGTALAGGSISESWARKICDWSGLLPEGSRGDADQILLAAAAGGASLADLAGLAEEMYRRSAPPDTDDDGGFGDRSLTLDVHFRGAGKLAGDLTPECAAALTAVLESLGRKAGPEDDRTKPQRDHDALEDACRRLIGAGGLPDVAGQPVQVQLHMTLDQLRSMDGAGDLERAWLAGRAAGDGQPGWLLSRAAAEAYACDAQLAPVVSGHLNHAVLAQLTEEFVAGLRPGFPGGISFPAPDGTGSPGAAAVIADGTPIRDRRAPRSPDPAALPPRTLARLRDTLAWYAADILSGPAGLAGFLRTGLLAADFPPAVSLPLDVGTATATVPPHLRRAVIARDRHCAFPGCAQRPAACHVHHLIPRAKGGPTALWNLTLLCSFHHLIAIHRWGWTLALNGDGTTTATSPDGHRVFRSHGPPTATAA